MISLSWCAFSHLEHWSGQYVMKELTKNILVEYLDWCASLDSISLKTLSPFVLFISFWKNPKFIENSLLLIILIMINNFLTYNTLLIHFPNGEIIN